MLPEGLREGTVRRVRTMIAVKKESHGVDNGNGHLGWLAEANT